VDCCRFAFEDFALFLSVKIRNWEFYRSLLDVVQKHQHCCSLGKGSPILEMLLFLPFPQKFLKMLNVAGQCASGTRVDVLNAQDTNPRGSRRCLEGWVLWLCRCSAERDGCRLAEKS